MSVAHPDRSLEKRWRLLLTAAALATLAASPGGRAETVAITHARVLSMGPAGDIARGMVVIRDGRIASVGPDGAGPAGARIVDAQGGVVTPGLIAVGAPYGVQEVGEGVEETDDDSTSSNRISAAFDPSVAVNPNSVLIPIARLGGITSAVITPIIRGGRGGALRPEPLMFAGQAAVIQLGGGANLVQRAHVGVVLAMGEAGGGPAGGSRAAQIALLKEILGDVRAYQRNKAGYEAGRSRALSLGRADLEALIPVVEGREPLIASVDRASDIRVVIALAREEKLKLILEGVAEGWRVAGEIAAAHVPVMVAGEQDLPSSFDAIGSRLDNAALMLAAGVEVVLEDPPIYEGGRTPRISAGRAAAHGLSVGAALAAITSVPARVFGLEDRIGSLAPGKDADLVVWSGDPLEPLSAPTAVFIKGVQQPMRSRDLDLRDRYMPRPAGQ